MAKSFYDGTMALLWHATNLDLAQKRFSSMPTKGTDPSDPGSQSPSTTATTPEQVPNLDNDIWASDDHDEDSLPAQPHRDELLSDLPTIKRQHMTDGYREGLAVGKAKVMQQGFDDGYPIGMQIALRAGKILGILEGYLASKLVCISMQNKASLQKSYDNAREELSCPSLLKGISDEVIAEVTLIPPHIDEVISKWEQLVLGTDTATV